MHYDEEKLKHVMCSSAKCESFGPQAEVWGAVEVRLLVEVVRLVVIPVVMVLMLVLCH